jgi:hypothetical protein
VISTGIRGIDCTKAQTKDGSRKALSGIAIAGDIEKDGAEGEIDSVASSLEASVKK